MGDSTIQFQDPDGGITDPRGVDGPSNQEFIRTVFGDLDGNVQPIIVSFQGDPNRVTGSSWMGQAWGGKRPGLPALSNNYFSLAQFKPDEQGLIRRRKSQFDSLRCVVLDDVGTKVSMERICLTPSWILETSPGNHQAGFLLADPITDGRTADRLMHAIVSAGLCDPGASGPQTRLARLPVGVNGKHNPPFQCRMQAWSPANRYTIEDLVKGMQLDLPSFNRKEACAGQRTRNIDHEGEPVWVPGPIENPVLGRLREHGLYKGLIGPGKHDVTCPWVDQHTGSVDSGTAYWEPDEQWPLGGFRCLHGHCTARKVRDLLGFLGVEINAARMKATIRIVAGEIHRVVDAAERELSQAHRYYQRGGLIVMVITDPGTRETRIQEIAPPALVRALAEVASWERHDARSQEWVRTDPPARHATVLYESVAYPHLPVLSGLARQPYLRPDGSLMMAAGYDRATGMFGVFDAQAFSVPEFPSRADAEAAFVVLSDLLAEFSFAREIDRAAALTAILTACVRPSLSSAPMFHARAHMLGSGKSYLCELITAFATPQRSAPTVFPGDDEECRKLLLAELLRAPAVIEFDNLTSDLVPHKSLCSALTSEFISGRILGVSKTASVSTRTLILSSGNNVGPVQDMTRRCITINLSPQCEIPGARTFSRPDLVRDVLRDRGRYVSAALTLIRAWIVAGRPKTPCRALAGFGEWTDLCRQPLLWLGIADPTESIFEAMAEDPDRDMLLRLLDAWLLVFGKTGAMVRDAMRRTATPFSRENSELRDALIEVAGERGEINPRKVGWWIRRHAGRIVDGKRIVRAEGNASAERWRVELVPLVSPVSPVSCLPSEESSRELITGTLPDIGRAG